MGGVNQVLRRVQNKRDLTPLSDFRLLPIFGNPHLLVNLFRFVTKIFFLGSNQQFESHSGADVTKLC